MRAVFLWAFTDRRTGRIVVAQAPNLLLWIAIAALALHWLLPSQAWLLWVERPALGLWGADEVLRGVNPWRRALGGAVLLTIAASLVR